MRVSPVAWRYEYITEVLWAAEATCLPTHNSPEGIRGAKAIAAANSIPLVAVDHIKGHIAACYLEADRPEPPYLALTASGGHTAIYHVKDYSDISVVGSTRDDAIGESFDKIGRLIGIPYPAGKGFDALATEGFKRATGKESGFFETYRRSAAYRDPDMTLPSPAIADGSFDFSFSGLKTAAINLLHRFEQRGEELDRALFAARYTYEAVEAVAKKVDAAMKAYPGASLSISGGVAANSHLRERLSEVARRNGRKIYVPSLSLCGDNAAMIAVAGYFEYKLGNLADSSLNASAEDGI
jgi:N6-L-threonylcarbamoyladenine synthase